VESVKKIRYNEGTQHFHAVSEKGEDLMIILITGASHTGKTVLAQRLLEQYHYTYLSVDHLKMGLIRSGQTALTPMSSQEDLTEYLWPILREIVKTTIENRQNLIVEGCYIPFDWAKDFAESYREHIRCVCLVMTPEYIRTHWEDIRRYANAVEQRLDDSDCTMEGLLEDNARFAARAAEAGMECIRIDREYTVEL
jgi:uridine kinase